MWSLTCLLCFFVSLALLVYYSYAQRQALIVISLMLTLLATTGLMKEKWKAALGLVPKRPAHIASQLAGDTIYCVMWMQSLDGTDHLAAVVNMTDPGLEIRVVRTMAALPDAKECFSLIRGIVSKTRPTRDAPKHPN